MARSSYSSIAVLKKTDLLFSKAAVGLALRGNLVEMSLLSWIWSFSLYLPSWCKKLLRLWRCCGADVGSRNAWLIMPRTASLLSLVASSFAWLLEPGALIKDVHPTLTTSYRRGSTRVWGTCC